MTSISRISHLRKIRTSQKLRKSSFFPIIIMTFFLFLWIPYAHFQTILNFEHFEPASLLYQYSVHPRLDCYRIETSHQNSLLAWLVNKTFPLFFARKTSRHDEPTVRLTITPLSLSVMSFGVFKEKSRFGKNNLHNRSEKAYSILFY